MTATPRRVEIHATAVAFLDTTFDVAGPAAGPPPTTGRHK
jgi:hypothetical protein